MKKIEKTVDIPLLDEIPSETPKSTPRSFMSNLNDLKSGILMRRKSLWEEMPDREIRFNETQEHFKNNKVNTSKYTCLTFIPKNFIEQFSKLANIYFLIIGFLQLIPEISASLGVPVILFPLTVILIVTAFKDLFEDLKRKKSDAQENNRKTLILTSDGEFKPITWELLQVGNIVKIKENEYFPADIILLNSGDAKGICFIETKNLDGETNLKRKSVQKDLNYMKNLSDYELSKIDDLFHYEKPNPFLYNFKGNITHGDDLKIPLDNSNFVLRDCSLRNTHFIIGMVAYTGHETKIMLNSTKARAKRSTLERAMNKQIIIVFVFQLIFCLFSSLYGAIWYTLHFKELHYLEINPNQAVDNYFWYNLTIRYGSWIIIFQNFVPISLIVTLEMVKFIQGIFISNDLKMKSIETGMTSVHTSSLNEELGQVDYIFSDKTGTLTCNFMEFKKVSIAGESFGEDHSLNKEDIKHNPIVSNVDFRDRDFFLKLKDSDSKIKDSIKESLFGIALCHTIIAEFNDKGELIYNASSPDELALVNWARFCGCEFLGTDESNRAKVSYQGKVYFFEVLQVLEFNSSRKRQSIIVKNEQNEILLYTKGADSVIEKRLKKKDNIIKEITWKNLEKYAVDGLRTLVLAKRNIKLTEYTQWAKKYTEVSSTLKNREEKMEEMQELIELDLELLAATAIEDKLQDQVGNTIESLKNAGIKFWVLTGDKIETAINIGYSCKLLDDKLEIIIVDGKESFEVESILDEKLKYLESKKRVRGMALVISGDALTHANVGEMSKKVNLATRFQLIFLAEKCSAVIACRVSPKQKQEIVTLVKMNKPNSITLAIGDGANDVNMITAAHVGVGIRGVEGQQAARASDYVLGEFKFLKRLVLYYGRESYRRNSHLIFYNFFKNMVLVLPQFWFGFLNGFSGQNIYNPFLYQLYNILHASIPIFLYGVLDKEYSGHFLMDNPSLYYIGLKNKLFNSFNFWVWIMFGVIQSFLITFPTFYAMESNFIDAEYGYNFIFWGSGMVIYGAIIINTNLKLLIFSHTHTLFSVLIILFSIVSYYILFAITSKYISEFSDFSCAERIFQSGNFYLLTIIIVIITTFFDLGIERFKHLRNKHILIEEKELLEKQELELDEFTYPKKVQESTQKYTGYAFCQDESTIDEYYKFAEN